MSIRAPLPILSLLALLSLAVLPRAAAAQDSPRIDNRAGFLSLVQGAELRHLGVRMIVRPDGQLSGRAFGRQVSGNWRWEEGYFCRVIYWGSEEFPWNCQLVERTGKGLRFTSDRGSGDSAELSLN